MVDPRRILKNWRCRRMRPLLVDAAERALDEPRQGQVNRHIEACEECAAALSALQQVPGLLRALPRSTRDEEYWRRQRQSILRRLEPVVTPGEVSVVSRRFTWAAGLAAAAAVVVAIVALRSPAPPPFAVAEVEGLDGDDVVALADLAQVWSGDPDIPIPAVMATDLEPAEIVWMAPEQADDGSDVGDLDEDELQRLEDLIG